MPSPLFDYVGGSFHTMGESATINCPEGQTPVCQPIPRPAPVTVPMVSLQPGPIRNPAYCQDQTFNPETGAIMELVSNPSYCAIIGGCVQIGDCYYRDLPRMVNPPFELPSPIALPPKTPEPPIRPSPITPGGRPPSPTPGPWPPYQFFEPSPYPSPNNPYADRPEYSGRDSVIM